ncbi:CRISPR-associated protein Cas4 [Fulvivirga maritima]|uniref:CRISPR-associated protein Cas4 n=1 Tax=Fulvivirga maritima TaxID=2904247 RepID=UPI001F2F7E42|nr:CRISPR-associated protein Cas4 [Fulvivirga maritima]UII25136.1 CRISPR-associated protein Cas4 [Fulvivirga maritima]
MIITATHINYYHICHRKLWLFSRGIQMEHTSEVVEEAKLIHESSYPQRSSKYTELDLGVAKIDFYDEKNKVVHEIKKSRKMETAHQWQVKYYLLLLRRAGVPEATAILEYPTLKKTMEVFLSDDDAHYLEEVEQEIEQITRQEKVPEKINKSFCKKCSYYDLCWVE